MVRQPIHRVFAASLMFTAAAAWPFALCALAALRATPLERAMRGAWCGDAPSQFEAIGHCPACWIGAATLALAGLLILAWPLPSALRSSAGMLRGSGSNHRFAEVRGRPGEVFNQTPPAHI